MENSFKCPRCGSRSCVEWFQVTTGQDLQETETTDFLCLGCHRRIPDRRKKQRSPLEAIES